MTALACLVIAAVLISLGHELAQALFGDWDDDDDFGAA